MYVCLYVYMVNKYVIQEKKMSQSRKDANSFTDFGSNIINIWFPRKVIIDQNS